MAEWKPLKQDFSIWKKFDFEYPAVAVKYLYYRPEGVKQMEGHVALCEMFLEAGKADEPFYITKENEDCIGKIPLGWVEDSPAYVHSGQLGEIFNIFQEPRANQRLYDRFYNLTPGVINYVMFAKLEDCFFEPDLIICVAPANDAERILRAMSYTTGEPWEPKASLVLGCSWIYAYPYITGKVNYLFTGMHFGMKGRKVLPPGLVMLSIPYDWIKIINDSLNEMPWDCPAYLHETRESWMEEEARCYAALEEKATKAD